MRNRLDRTIGGVTSTLRGVKDEVASEIPGEVGFHFSAWFFLTAVVMAFLDAFFFGGDGFGHYLSVPTDVLAQSRALVNI